MSMLISISEYLGFGEEEVLAGFLEDAFDAAEAKRIAGKKMREEQETSA